MPEEHAAILISTWFFPLKPLKVSCMAHCNSKIVSSVLKPARTSCKVLGKGSASKTSYCLPDDKFYHSLQPNVLVPGVKYQFVQIATQGWANISMLVALVKASIRLVEISLRLLACRVCYRPKHSDTILGWATEHVNQYVVICSPEPNVASCE